MTTAKSIERQISHFTYCSWCDLSCITPSLPKVFCWTRMQAESGQSLDMIIRRKELERAAGEGFFYWGIGNALGPGMVELLRRTSQPEVLFSVMRAKPKAEDVAPASVLLWTQSVDAKGHLQPLPGHALVLSRGATATGAEKRCYALVCHSDVALSLSPLASFDLAHFRNISGNQGNVGFSQVTTNIEHRSAKPRGATYDVSLRALLKPPYFIKLAGAKRVLEKDREAIITTMAADPSPEKWLTFVGILRSHSHYAIGSRNGSTCCGGQ